MLPFLLLATATAIAAPAPLEDGRHALFMRSATQARLPVLGERPGASEAWVLVDVKNSGPGTATAVHRPCAVRVLGAGDRANVRLGPGFLEAMGSRATTWRFHPDSSGWAVETDLGMHHVGYDPATTGGLLPSDAKADGVVDHEGDGHPGATVIVDVPVLGELEIYIAQRTHQSLHGRLTDDGTLEGGIHGHALDQETLDATSALMKVSPVMRPDPDRSAWWMVTVPEDTTCETLASRACEARATGIGCPDGLASAQRW